jgi:hypothetical protein
MFVFYTDVEKNKGSSCNSFFDVNLLYSFYALDLFATKVNLVFIDRMVWPNEKKNVLRLATSFKYYSQRMVLEPASLVEKAKDTFGH